MNNVGRGRERAHMRSGTQSERNQEGFKAHRRAAPSHAQIQTSQEAPLQPAGRRGDGSCCSWRGGHRLAKRLGSLSAASPWPLASPMPGAE